VPSDLTVLTSAAALFTSSGTFAVDRCVQIVVARWLTGQSGGTPDSPVSYSGAWLREPESGWFEPCTGLVHQTLSGGTPDSPVRQTSAHLVAFAPFELNP
jgi:hypothetical protein